MFFLPKTSDTTITELYIENMIRPSVFATAIVPLDDMKMLGRKGGESGQGKAGEERQGTTISMNECCV